VVVDGAVNWLHVKAEMVRNAAGRPVKAIGMSQDITEMREAQLALEAYRDRLEELVAARTAELRQQTHYLRTLIDGFPFWVWLKDTESRYLAVNRVNAESSGRSVEEIIGKTDLDIWPQELAQSYRADDREVMASRRLKMVEEEFVHAGRRLWIETYKAPVLDEDGTVLGTVGFARDITERKAAEAAREAALAGAERLARAKTSSWPT
jgi:PAS domain S-box-containing protein